MPVFLHTADWQLGKPFGRVVDDDKRALIEFIWGSEGFPSQRLPDAVAQVETRLTAPQLLAQLQSLEQAAGRERPYRNAPRTLDLDLLDYEGRVEPGPPELPHPRLATRAFVLVPLRDVAPGAGLERMRELLEHAGERGGQRLHLRLL